LHQNAARDHGGNHREQAQAGGAASGTLSANYRSNSAI
jgi:hypothetical protein